MKKKTIAIDCDEVLANTVDSILAHYAYTFNNLPLSKDAITDFYRYKMETHGASKEYTLTYREDFFQSSTAGNIAPVAGAVEGVRQLAAAGHDLYVVTSRRNTLEALTLQRIEQHFPGVFVDVVFPKASVEDHNLTNKADLMRSIGATYLIDDALHNCIDVVSGGYEAILLDYPWNQADSLAPNITRVPHREEVVKRMVGKE